MLNEGKVFATLAVRDLAAAKEFYGGKLGLNQVDENPAGVMYESGGGKLFVYRSDTAGTSKATSASWMVDDVEAVVQDLQGKGVAFQHYDMPGAQLNGDIYTMGPMKTAWFTDPDGNILNVGSGM